MINCIPLIYYNCTANATEAKLNSRKLLNVCIIIRVVVFCQQTNIYANL